MHVRKIHLDVKKFKCNECNFASISRSLLAQHVKSVHDKVKDHKCDICDYAGSKWNSLLFHTRRHHDRCPGCDEALLKKATEGHKKLTKAAALGKFLSIKGSCNPGMEFLDPMAVDAT